LNIANDSSIIANITIARKPRNAINTLSIGDNTDGSLVLDSAFQVNGAMPPALVSISPATANAGQTLDVTIKGSNTLFTREQSQMYVYIESWDYEINVNSLKAINDTVLTANITIGSDVYAEKFDVYFSGYSDNENLTLDTAFFVPGKNLNLAPVLVSISPASATVGQTLNVTITGINTHFNETSELTDVLSSDNNGNPVVLVNSITIINDTALTASITVASTPDVTDSLIFYTFDLTDGNVGFSYYNYNSFPFVVLASPVNVKTINSENSISIYPNPANTGFTVNTDEQARVEVYSTNGILVLSTKVSDKENIPLGNITAGIYFVRITTAGTVVAKSLVVRK